MAAPCSIDGDHFFAVVPFLPLFEELSLRALCRPCRADVAKRPRFWEDVIEARFCRIGERELQGMFSCWRRYKDCLKGVLARGRERQLQQLMFGLRFMAEMRGASEAP